MAGKAIVKGVEELVKKGSKAKEQWKAAANVGEKVVVEGSGTSMKAAAKGLLRTMGEHKKLSALGTIAAVKATTGQGALETSKDVLSWLVLDEKRDTGNLGKDIVHQVAYSGGGDETVEKVDDAFSGIKDFLSNPVDGIGGIFKNIFGGIGDMAGSIFGGNGSKLLGIGTLIPALFLTFGRYGFLGKVMGAMLAVFAFSNMFKGGLINAATQAIGVGQGSVGNQVLSAQDQRELSAAAANRYDMLMEQEDEDTVKAKR